MDTGCIQFAAMYKTIVVTNVGYAGLTLFVERLNS